MKRFATTTELIEAYTIDHNSRCRPDKHFTPAEIERHFLTTMTRHALLVKYGVSISDKQTSTIPGFGYVDAAITGEADEFRSREIRYSRHTHDYDMYLDGEYRGSRGSYHQAEVDLDTLVGDLLAAGIHRSASEPDGSGDPDETAAAVNWSSAPERCTPDVQGRYWTVCGGPCDEPCMCDVVVRAALM